MNGETYKEISSAVTSLGYEVLPKPVEGEDVRFFDVISEGTAIMPHRVLNAIHVAAHLLIGDIRPEVVGTQSHCLSFEDKSY